MANHALREEVQVKTVLFSFIPVRETSMVASTRIARYVSDLLKVPLIDDSSIGEQRPDVLLIVNGAYAFCKHLEPLSHAIKSAQRIVWIQNDFTLGPPISDGQAMSPFRRAFVERHEQGKSHVEFWTTLEIKTKATSLSSYVNWNCLTFNQTDRPKRPPHDNALFYYGSFRAGRVSYFDRYFKNPKVETIVSSPSKKFSAYPVTLIPPMLSSDMNIELGKYGLGLYIEDKFSHKEFTSPANRFYEMLSAGLPMVFQPECGSMLRRAGYNPEPWTVDKASSIEKAMVKSDEIWYDQRCMLMPKAREERKTLDAATEAAWKKIKEAVR